MIDSSRKQRVGQRSKKWMLSVILASIAMICVACRGDSPEAGGEDAEIVGFAAGTPWPQTLEGELEIAVEDGSVGADGISEVNFGSITTVKGTYMLDIPGSAIREAGLSREEANALGPAKVTVGGPSEFSTPDMPSYNVTELEPLDP